MSTLVLNPILAFTQGGGSPTQATDHPCPIHWDLRKSSVEARLNGDPNSPLTFGHLGRPATDPKLDSLDITCGMLEKWPIKVRRPEGIDVIDVLENIRKTLLCRVSRTEFERFSKGQQEKITAVFVERCNKAQDPDKARENGVLRLDCLLQHTIFAGLSVSLDKEKTCILTLRRRQQPQN
ncbi:hypothetical protein BDN70DRAFT_811415 [Pholiota conissans]|uniref:DUF6699 domain-containing protein n=1 Tax=Pholiota conissans TaxID=109636 RepID=A0A9P5YYN5_9AGAR|nr:hypothetical protein BDN70DRAFT_811415 [Pholiota conissans]